MKRIITSAFTFGLIALIFTSCSRYSDLSIAKRHYRSGYYVEYNSGRKAEPTVQEAKVNTGKTNSQVDINIPSNTKTLANSIVQAKPTNQTNTTATTSSPSSPNNNFALAKKFRNAAPAEPSSDIRKIEQVQHKSIEYTKALFHSTKNYVEEARHHGGGGGHSLLWWIIVILLVICVIDLLDNGFLGTLIWLILVIALVLLLLRLLEML